MDKFSNIPVKLKEASVNMHGVFQLGDLANLFGNTKGITLAKRIQLLIERSYLKRAINGVYYTEEAKIEHLAKTIFQDGYFSLTTAMAKHKIIGTHPARKIHVLTTRSRGREFKTDIGTISMHVIKEDYFFGYETIDGIKIATREKSFVDTCYFAMRKMKFPFNLYTDISVSFLDKDKIKEHLENFKNKKFITYTNNVLAEYE